MLPMALLQQSALMSIGTDQALKNQKPCIWVLFIGRSPEVQSLEEADIPRLGAANRIWDRESPSSVLRMSRQLVLHYPAVPKVNTSEVLRWVDEFLSSPLSLFHFDLPDYEVSLPFTVTYYVHLTNLAYSG